MFFNLYINKLNEKFNNSKIGACMGFKIIKSCMLCWWHCSCDSLWKGLQELIDICQMSGEGYDVMFNADKTKCMVFKLKSYTIIEH